MTNRSVDARRAPSAWSCSTSSAKARALSKCSPATLIEAEKSGLFVTYRLAEGVEGFYLDLRRLAEARLAEVEATTRAYLEERGAMESVDSDALLQRALSGDVTVLDVRPPEEYRAGHLANARSVPLPELRSRLGELPKDREVVAYCRGATACSPSRRYGSSGRRATPRSASNPAPPTGAWPACR